MRADDFNVIDLNKTDTIPSSQVEDYLKLEQGKAKEVSESESEGAQASMDSVEDITILPTEEALNLHEQMTAAQEIEEPFEKSEAEATEEPVAEETDEPFEEEAEEPTETLTDEATEEPNEDSPVLSDTIEIVNINEMEEELAKQEAELGDLNYHDEDVKPVRKVTKKAVKPAEKQLKKSAAKSDRGNFWLNFSIAAVAAALIIVGAIIAVVYTQNRKESKMLEAFAPVGESLVAMNDNGSGEIARILGVRLDNEQASEQASEDAAAKPDNIVVSVSLTSMEKDLKIKFADKATDKLICDVKFEVELVTPNKETVVWDDEDGDGVIYQKDLKAGEYSVTIHPIDGFMFPTEATSVTVKDKIAYQAINIIDEVKKESEVNAAIEDTENQDEVDTEPLLADTVEWVESTVTQVGGGDGYAEIKKETIPDPATVTAMTIGEMGDQFAASISNGSTVSISSQTSEIGSEEPGSSETSEKPSETSEKPSETSEEPLPSEQPSCVKSISMESSKSMSIGDKTKLSVTVVADSGVSTDVTWSSSDSAVVSVDGSGNIEALKSGSATITATTKEKDINGNTLHASCSITVLKQEEFSVVLNSKTAELLVGKTVTLTATVTGYLSDASVKWSTADKKIATVDDKGVVTAVKAGIVTITATTVEKTAAGKALTATCTVTVKNDSENDKTSLLKNKDGKQVYIKIDDKTYEKAKYADYYTAKKFYIVSEKVYKYTGWQTINNKTYYYDKNGKYVTGEQVIRGVKYNFASDGSLSMNGGVLGIDVSKWNGNIDWNAVKNSGISFVIIRCGYRGSSTGVLVEDPKFRTYITGATGAGLKVGVYFFTQAINEVEAVEEASMTIALMKGYKISYPVFIDTEKTSGGRANNISVATRTAVCRAFCETIKSAGYTPGVYASKTWYQTNVTVSNLSAYRIWLAQYASAPSYSGRYDLWQYTDKGTVNGISGSVDLNISYLGY